jgi:ferredoxin--NADP+ reductase
VEEIECGLVLRSIGYRGLPVDDVPFEPARGLIRNEGGRVCDERGRAQQGEYVAGWIKRGPSGVIGTNKKDSADTTARVIEDAQAGSLNSPRDPDADAVADLIRERVPDVITWDGWCAIDENERRAGSARGRPRVKFVRRADLVAGAGAGAPAG